MAKFGREAAAQTAARIARWKTAIQFEAHAIKVPASIIAAIISRETAGLDMYCLPPPKGRLGDGGHGCGPMQIDDRSWSYWTDQWKAGKLTVQDGIHMGCQVLVGKMKSIARLIPEMPEEQRLRAAIAAYNTGESNVRKSFRSDADVDRTTTGKNYSKDVLERASYFADNRWDA